MNLRVILTLTSQFVFFFVSYGLTTWTGTVSTNWNDPANWTNGLPSSVNDATIPAFPSGMYYPIFSANQVLHFNIQNFGVLNIEGNGEITVSGTFVNYSNSSFVVADAGAKFVVQAGAIFENYGIIFNNGEFRNEGTFLNAPTGNFGNSAVFESIVGSAFSNQGTFDNFSEFSSEADFFNAGVLNNHNFFRNGFQAQNTGVFNAFFGSVFQNDFEFSNQQGASFATDGNFVNQHFFENEGEMITSSGAHFSNTGVVENKLNATWNHAGFGQNHPCAVLKNDGSLVNAGIIINQGIIFDEGGITSNPIENQGIGFVFSPGGIAAFCENASIVLDPVSGLATVTANDLTNLQLLTCGGWNAQINGQPSLTFAGCNALGLHQINVQIVHQLGLALTCQSTIEVVDSNAPVFISCPADLTVNSGDCDEVVSVDWTLPQASDLCLVDIFTNLQPGTPLTAGTTTVVYTAADQSGNVSQCSFSITVKPGMTISCPDDIKVSIPAGDTSSFVHWNMPEGLTQCQVCLSEEIPGYSYLGTLDGHRFYLYLGGEVTWNEANALALAEGGYLAEISKPLENVFLKNEFLPIFSAAWIGLSDAQTEGSFSWSNGADFTYSNWEAGSLPQNDQLDYVIFQKNGEWKDQNGTAKHTFILEKPCIETQAGSSMPATLADFNFPIGTTAIFLNSTDACGNQCSCSFNVVVEQELPANYCAAGSNSAKGWIDSVESDGFSFYSGDDGGYGDHSGISFEMPDPGCFLKLTPGGENGAYLYWRIWADMNEDGDFFDPDEMLASVEGAGPAEVCFDFPRDLPIDGIRLRVAMSRFQYPSPCGDFQFGEVEDYSVRIIEADSFFNTNCNWSFANFQVSLEQLSAKLAWEGDGDCQIDTFFVDWSADGIDFKELDALTPVAVATNQPAHFEYWDMDPQRGENFYRVRVKFSNGQEISSPVGLIEIAVDLQELFMYPNPVSGTLFVNTREYAGKQATFRVTDSMGRLVMIDPATQTLEVAPYRFDTGDLAPGVYFLFLKIEGERSFYESFIVR